MVLGSSSEEIRFDYLEGRYGWSLGMGLNWERLGNF